MTTILIKNGHVIDPTQNRDGKFDVLVNDGKIAAILNPGETPKIKPDEVFDAAGLIVAPGFIDLHTHLREPGQEYKETIRSGTGAAVAGGFTAVCCMANTVPVNDNASVTQYILKKAQETGSCPVYPIGAITKNLDGQELAAIAELKEAGCVAISDDGRTVQNAQLMRLALDYAKGLDLPVATHSIEAELARDGCMNESIVSTKLGLKGSPAVAEDIIIARDIMLAEVTGAHLHVAHLSTAGGVRLVREGKARGVNVSAEAAPHHFTLTDEDIRDYDTNFKMCPPLRGKADRDALRAALADGTIDCIATDHAPHGVIDKEVEFDKAAWGIIGFETALALTLNLVRDKIITLKKLVELMSVNPAKLFKLPGGSLQIGTPANITIFSTTENWVLSRETIFSKSKNSPFLGKTLTGRVKKTIVNGEVRFSL